MRRTPLRAVVTAAVLAVAAPSAKADLIAGVRIVDVEAGTVSAPRDLRVDGGLVAEIAEAGALEPRAGERVFDGRGAYALPGLWDGHVHVFSSPTEADTALPSYILNGVTGIRDMGALVPLADQRRIAAEIEAGRRTGPRIVISGAWVDASPGSWPGMRLADTEAEARAVVEDVAAAGYPAIKTYSMLRPAPYRALVAEARRIGLPVVGHVPETVTLDTAMEAGQSGIEHFGRVAKACSTREAEMVAGVRIALAADEPLAAMIAEMTGHTAIMLETFDEDLCEAVLARMAEARLHVSPTLVVADFYIGERPAEDALRMRLLPDEVRAAWNRPDFRLEGMTDELRVLADRSLALDHAVFRKAHAAGVPMIASSDASYANPFIFHGFSLLDELDRYVDIGLTPQEALVTATVTPPRFFGLSDQDGRIAVGRRADILIVGDNPLEGLATLRDPRAVIANGRVFDTAALAALRAALEGD
ncbi:MAG: amidohydrolase family protein [Paracoccaceae bacterium]|nr:amidohydrolase family protein [Paracoccaceae bacterium]